MLSGEKFEKEPVQPIRLVERTVYPYLVALQTYRPRRVVVRRIATAPAATVCVGTTCSLPVDTPARLTELLA